MTERDEFPNGANLAKLSSPDNDRGELKIPLPYDGDDELVLRWEKIHGFEVSDEFAWQWGYRHKHTKKGYHLLGRFFFNGEELLPMEKHSSYWGVEHFHECRFDVDGNDAMGSNVDFPNGGEQGWNTTLLMDYVPKAGQFNAKAPVKEIIAIRFGYKGEYKLAWEPRGAQWNLEIRDEKERGDVRTADWVTYEFDFHQKTMSFGYNYMPTDYD